MGYMLDTCICSYILKRRPPAVKARFEALDPDALCISAVTLAELYYGAARHPKGETIRKEIDDFVARLTVVSWDETAADHYGAIRASLEKHGSPIGAMDMLIAAHARSIGAVLVTNDLRHFTKVPGIKVEDWS
jgi:tRNA(fMet)-specific endonuclease VapC